MKIINNLLLLTLILGFRWAEAHTLPQCKAQLLIQEHNVLIQFKAPLEILELAEKNNINLHSKTSLDSLKNYLLSHISISDSLQSNWKITVGDILVQQANDQYIGNFAEISCTLILTPSNISSLRNFMMNCDLVIHQIPTQSIIFSVKQDWQNGIFENSPNQIGIIHLDIPTGKISPLKIKIDEGSWLKGLYSMLNLGRQHIKEGTDHILFLLVLLLPAMLVIKGKHWSGFGGIQFSLIRILKIVTAFTIGHSVTLIIGAFGIIHIQNQVIEILITFTIIISAIHAFKPIFAGKETYIAAGFGLIHGMAFASTLLSMSLDKTALLLGILGFNLGIEIEQIFLISLTIPLLILLSQTSFYVIFRKTGAVLIGIIACAWLSERMTSKSNIITIEIEKIAHHGYFLLLIFIIFTVLAFLVDKISRK